MENFSVDLISVIDTTLDNLSFYIVIDEQNMTVDGGYSDVVSWISEPVPGPLPEGHHKAKEKSKGWWYVFDIQKNSSDSKNSHDLQRHEHFIPVPFLFNY